MKLLLVAGGAWLGAVLSVAVLAVLGGPGTAGGTPVTATGSMGSAVSASRSLVGTPTGWHRMCDRLACRAYGLSSSGYPTAQAHWDAMLTTGHAHPGDRCPPPGTFAFWSTASGQGHVALVSGSDAYCDPTHITVISNDVLDGENATIGGVYEVSLTRIETGFVSRANYLGWSDPVCIGVLLDTRTTA
jgi:hypothetical protein